MTGKRKGMVVAMAAGVVIVMATRRALAAIDIGPIEIREGDLWGAFPPAQVDEVALSV